MTPLLKMWLMALRHGGYDQGQYSLRQAADPDLPSAYCCLGVACDISEVGAWEYSQEWGYRTMEQTRGKKPVIEDTVSKEMLPDSVQAQLGLRTNVGHFRPTSDWLGRMAIDYPEVHHKIITWGGFASSHYSLPLLNDAIDPESGEPVFTFEDIAAIIESRPPGLFNADADLQPVGAADPGGMGYQLWRAP